MACAIIEVNGHTANDFCVSLFEHEGEARCAATQGDVVLAGGVELGNEVVEQVAISARHERAAIDTKLAAPA